MLEKNELQPISRLPLVPQLPKIANFQTKPFPAKTNRNRCTSALPLDRYPSPTIPHGHPLADDQRSAGVVDAMTAPLSSFESRVVGAVAAMSRALACCSCHAFLAEPFRSVACGDVVCNICADNARVESRCGRPGCEMPARPGEVARDREIASLTDAVANLRQFTCALLPKARPCALQLRVRAPTEQEQIQLALRVRAPNTVQHETQSPEPEKMWLRLRVRSARITAKRKRPRVEAPEALKPTEKAVCEPEEILSNEDPCDVENALDAASFGDMLIDSPSNFRSARPAKKPRPIPGKRDASNPEICTVEPTLGRKSDTGELENSAYAANNATDRNLDGGREASPRGDAAEADADIGHLRDNSPTTADVGSGRPITGKVSPVTSEHEGVITTPYQVQRGSLITNKIGPDNKSEADCLSTQMEGNLRVCLTGLSRDDHEMELAEELIASLGGEIIHDFCSTGKPFCVVTPLDESRTIKHRTMHVHEALARRVPIVSLRWLVASFKHGAWAQTDPFEAATKHRKDGKGIFHRLLVSFDDAFFREDASVLVRKAGEDMRRVVRAGGAVLADVRQVGGILAKDDDFFFLHVHVACDFGEHSAVGPQISGDDMELLRSSQQAVATRVVNMPWISDCLFSGMCPPPNNERSESMSAFSEYTASEGEVTPQD